MFLFVSGCVCGTHTITSFYKLEYTSAQAFQSSAAPRAQLCCGCAARCDVLWSSVVEACHVTCLLHWVSFHYLPCVCVCVCYARPPYVRLVAITIQTKLGAAKRMTISVRLCLTGFRFNNSNANARHIYFGPQTAQPLKHLFCCSGIHIAYPLKSRKYLHQPLAGPG